MLSLEYIYYLLASFTSALIFMPIGFKIIQKLNILCQDHINSTQKSPSQFEVILPDYQSAYNEYNKK